MFDQLPEGRRQRVQSAIATAFPRLESLHALGGGLSTALIFRMVADGRSYLLRAGMSEDELRDPRRHFACLQIASDAGLAPAARLLDVEAHVAVTDFIEAPPLSVLQRPRAELLVDLAGMVRRLQAAPAFPPLVHYLDGVGALIGRARGLGILPAQADEVFERHAALARAYPRDPVDLVSSHNDLNPGNMIWDGARLWIVDWEASFLNDRYVDPACVCNFFTSTPEEEQLFLTAYFGAQPDARQRARIFVMRQACHMAFACMMLQLGARPGLKVPAEALDTPPLATVRPRMRELLYTPEGQIHLGLTTLGQVLSNTRSDGYAHALRALAD
jgi:aminoglycoside phosphotransferase (APT) family kinase protein